MPKRYPEEFRRKVLDLVAAGRPVAQIAADLNISDQTIYGWRKKELIDTGQLGVGVADGDRRYLLELYSVSGSAELVAIAPLVRVLAHYCSVIVGSHRAGRRSQPDRWSRRAHQD